MNIGNRCIRHGCRMLVQYYMMTWHQQSSHWLIKWMRQNVMWLVWSIRKGYVERLKFFFFLSSFVYFDSRLQYFVYLWFSFSLFLFSLLLPPLLFLFQVVYSSKAYGIQSANNVLVDVVEAMVAASELRVESNSDFEDSVETKIELTERPSLGPPVARRLTWRHRCSLQ